MDPKRKKGLLIYAAKNSLFYDIHIVNKKWSTFVDWLHGKNWFNQKRWFKTTTIKSDNY